MYLMNPIAVDGCLDFAGTTFSMEAMPRVPTEERLRRGGAADLGPRQADQGI